MGSLQQLCRQVVMCFQWLDFIFSLAKKQFGSLGIIYGTVGIHTIC